MTTVTLTPGDPAGIDTYIQSAVPTTNRGTLSFMEVGRRPGDIRRGLILFDLSSIPSDAVITDAFVRLTISDDATTVDANRNVSFHRALVSWQELQATWNVRLTATNWNTAGGGSGTDYAASASDTQAVGSGGTVDWDVTSNVSSFVSGALTNNGWFIIGAEATDDDLKRFFASDASSFRPSITITFTATREIVGTSNGIGTVSGTLSASGNLEGTSIGLSTVSAILVSNEYIEASVQGLSTVSGTLVAAGYLVGSSVCSSIAEGNIQGEVLFAPGVASGIAIVFGDIKGIYSMVGASFGSSTTFGTGSFEGQLRGQSDGTSTALALGWARAKSVIQAVECNFAPLLYLTDGTVKNNGQLNLVDFLVKTNGFLLQNYRPQIAQYKEGGRFSNGPLSQGRRLRYRNFDNAIDVFELSIASYDQDGALSFIHELLAFQEAAADYWVSDYKVNPVYLVARSPKETYERYAAVHMISVPELQNPYSQNFFSRYNAQMTLTVRIERGHWLDVPPGRSECVAVSSVRSWTVSEWQTGS